MRHNYLILSAFLLAGCTIHQENGNAVQLDAPPIIAGNHWQITKKDRHVCTLAAGEMLVTQLNGKNGTTYQVGTSTSLNPGDRYRIIMNGDVHETPQGESTFSQSESQAIVAELKNGGTVYTEIQQRVIKPGSEYERLGNKIDVSGFGKTLASCNNH